VAEAAGLVGGGVIGAGWAARFLLNGADVRIFDPDPEAPRKVAEVVDNARRAFRKLTLVPLPAEGTLTFVGTPEEAGEGAFFIQESAPEREDVKRALLAAVSRTAGPDVVVASSTSGLLPTRLQTEMRRPERLAVGHPFNPVYLLPLVEVCGGAQTAPETLDRAAEIYRSIGMEPLLLRTEVDGFVADRLLEALWREALWLVADDVATVSEIDDAVRLGAGLRWSFMGTFLTYRIAGGEEGMRHFLTQFGPALRWPWTKLVDVPELSEELLEKIVAQSDTQANGRSARDLERLRDDCLVSVIQALRSNGVGAGAALASWERRLLAHDRPRTVDSGEDPSQPLRLHTTRVLPEWIDYNGHMHESRYLQAFADATDELLRYLGVDADYVERGSYFTVETHLSHLREAGTDDVLQVTTQLLGYDPKRLHVFHSLYRGADDALLATSEHMLLHVDSRERRAAPAADDVLRRVAALADAHARMPKPDRAGRSIGFGR
jgi:carnitine 3-dehydrogenase